jgi:hypothetical protein
LIKRNSFVEIEFLIDEILKISSDQEGSCFTADFQNRLFDLMSIPISEIDERVGDALLKLQKK